VFNFKVFNLRPGLVKRYQAWSVTEKRHQQRFVGVCAVTLMSFISLPVASVAADSAPTAESPGSVNASNCVLGEAPQRVYAANPIVTYLMMAMAPEKLVGWNFPPPAQAQGIFPKESFAKPVIGGWFGQGRSPNMEELVRARPDFMLMSGATVHTDQQTALHKMGIPVCTLKLETLEDYPQDIRQLGVWLQQSERAEALAKDMEQRLESLAKNRAALDALGLKKTVFYAESNSGLATECRGSIHSQSLPLAGALNPHNCPNVSTKQGQFGRVDINFEQLLRYNPDAIVTQEIGFYEQVYRNPKWQSLKAVQNRQVFFMPQVPYRWMDRPPTFMRVLAAQWLMTKLYPEQELYDMAAETKAMIQLFFKTELTAEQIEAILQGDIVDERR